MFMKRLEMAAHGGLRELSRGGQLSDPELRLFDQPKQSNSGEISELRKRRQPFERSVLARVFTERLRHASHTFDQGPGGSTSVGPGISP